MTKLEKVIKGLECCLEGNDYCPADCPYDTERKVTANERIIYPAIMAQTERLDNVGVLPIAAKVEMAQAHGLEGKDGVQTATQAETKSVENDRGSE